jgi:hypothetical protein
MGSTHSFHDIIEVALGTQDASRPPYDPIAVGNQPSAFCWAPFQDIQDMPDIFECKLGFAYTHAEAKQ